MKILGLLVIVAMSFGSCTAFPHPDEYIQEGVTQIMFREAIAAVRGDRNKALEMFAEPEVGPFRARDGEVYVVCFDRNTGMILSGPDTGKNVQMLTDSKGYAWGQKLFDAGKRPIGEVTVLSYRAPKPGAGKKEFDVLTRLTAADEQTVIAVGFNPDPENKR